MKRFHIAYLYYDILNLYGEHDNLTHLGFIGVIDTNGVVERILLENPKFISNEMCECRNP